MTTPHNPLLLSLSSAQLENDWLVTLKNQGIVTVGQLYDWACTRASELNRLLGNVADDVRDHLEKQWPQLKFSMEAMRSAKPWPAAISGLPGSPDDYPDLAEWRTETVAARQDAIQRIHQLRKQGALPHRIAHTDHLPKPYDQGPHGYCVGFGATTSRDYLARTWMSNGYAYRGAKHLDGRPDVEGSFQAYAFEFFYRYGHVPHELYSYEDAIIDRPVSGLFAQAGRWKISGYVDLLPDGDYSIVPDLMRAILSGRLVEDLGPRTLSVSLALFDSFNSYTTQRTGLVTLPGAEEIRSGGHAMSVVGYIDAGDPQGLFDTDWFIVRNSWGTQWAIENPLGHPGHALIPAAYFANPDWLWELLICIAEPPPSASLGWLRSLGRGFGRKSH